MILAKDDVIELEGIVTDALPNAMFSVDIGGENFVSGEDEQSIRDKVQWAVQQSLQGAAVWSYGQDDSGKLLAWLKEALSQ